MLSCPHCGTPIVLARLPHPSLFANYRECPECKDRFTVDTATKYRQALALVSAVVALIYTVLMYIHGSEWLFHSLVSYVILGSIIWWGNKRVRLVPYRRA